jgi:type II secretory ATPase GspE/PulE/Tfp pilus assembly ATPase PilB-like protein
MPNQDEGGGQDGVSIILLSYGEGVVMRILDRTTVTLDLENWVLQEFR